MFTNATTTILSVHLNICLNPDDVNTKHKKKIYGTGNYTLFYESYI